MSNKWETAKISREEYAQEWKKYLTGKQDRYAIAKKYGIDYHTVLNLSKKFEFPQKRPGSCMVDMDEFAEKYNRWATGEITRSELCKELGITDPTFRKWLYELYENNFNLQGLSFLFDEQKWIESNYKKL